MRAVGHTLSPLVCDWAMVVVGSASVRSQRLPGRGVRVARSGGRRRAACRAAATYDVTIAKPMGMVLEETKEANKSLGSVVVAEVLPDSNAEKAGVKAGDVLVSCSAVTLKAGKEGEFEKTGYGGRPFTNWEKVVFNTKDQTFDTTMAALASNNERWGFTTVDCTFVR